MLDLTLIFIEQLFLIWLKLFRQKQRNGREFLKSAIMTPLFIILFTAYVLFSSLTVYETPSTYAFHSLPPLSTTSAWGIFNATANGQSTNGLHSQRLYYSPSNHPGVQQLIGNLTNTYKSVVAVGCTDYGDMLNQYQSNLFNTWAYMEFNLNSEQLSTGKLVPNVTTQTQVDFTIMINPLQSNSFVTGSNTSLVYNNYICNADAFWQSGFMTLQNYVSNYLAHLYPQVHHDYQIDTYIQRYPKSSQYENQIQLSVGTARWTFFRWIGSTILSVCIFVPILGILTEIVRERQYKMKDLLEISGLMNSAYYISYFIFCQAVAQLTIWLPVIGLLSAIGIFNPARAPAYGALMTCYSLAMTSFSMGFGFIVFQSEYYALPIFILNTALAVAGAYLGIAYNMTVGAKMFVIFLAPPLGLSMGVIQIENYLYDFSGDMDFNFVNTQKNYPSLNAICGMLILSSAVYMFIVLGMPFDWIIPKNDDNFLEAIATSKADEVQFPCDMEEAADNGSADERLLEVNQLSHIYPDGTHAVKDMSFNIKSGEVLSFLGANGAGKSTCMGMLCGTLDATFGDALVSGFSISTDRVKARRKLGIAMQQDILWNDISVQDHLYIFGSIRGVHGAKLRKEVNSMIESLGFEEKRASLAGTLSGGQKRRLCVGLSMVGGNSVVYLDEPTAGLDPVSRRQLWELVQRNRKGRAILLTTHFMDEADVLGDRIAIVKEGRLRALGSADYLKKQFGLGYLLRMSLEEHADADLIVRTVSDRIPFATMASHAGTELSIRMPRESVVQFATLFEYIESNRKSLKILSFGIETTTLEEVFMRIVNEDSELLLQNHEQANKMLGAFQEERKGYDSVLIERDEKNAPFSATQLDALLCKGIPSNDFFNIQLIVTQVQSIVNKRFCQFRRSKGQFVMGLLLPILLSILIAVTIQAIPTTILGVQYDSYGFVYTPAFSTPVAGANENTTVNDAKKAFGGNKVYRYVGQTYDQLYNNLYPSNVAVAYNNMMLNNFSVAYNASTPTDFAGAVSELLAAATSNVTQNNLLVSLQGTTLPANLFGDQMNYGILAGFVLSVFAGAMGAGLSIVVGGERVNLVKHQQLASGASKIAYWLANFIFDFAVLFTNVILFSIFMAAINPDKYTGYGNQFIVGSGVVWAFASIFRFYVVSFFVADIRMAQYLFFYGSLSSMYLFANFWAIATFVGAQGNIRSDSASITGLFFSIVDPTFGWFLLILFQDNFLGIITQSPGENIFEISTYYLVGMFLGGVVYFLIFVFYLEGGYSIFFPTKLIAKLRVKRSGSAATRNLAAEPALRAIGGTDPDVVAEREKVHQKFDSGEVDDSADAIFINGLQKIYYGRGTVPTKVAVKNVSASIGVGEVFGLLGANGAGKTTLLKMVSGLETPTSGVAYINGYDVVDETSNAQRSMGLCPQFDTLIERMTVRENLLYFGQIKGLRNPELGNAVDAFMAAMNIKRYEKKLIMQLSGGNRRKVSLAVALLGAPPTVYLDEPSTGLDPVASRLMWRLLTKISNTKKTAMVLTTHNMLECEAVCTRICIMKLGEMVCLGDSQHLRSTHGTGFLLEMTLATPDAMDAAISFVNTSFPGAQIVDKHATMVNLEIPRSSITQLSAAFRALEERKAALRIVDYALSQSTLEQVFLKQIRPNERDFENDDDQVSKTKTRKATVSDLFFGYIAWFIALLLPGFHHFYLGNFWRGLKYFCTANEVYAGWVLDFFELNVLIQKSVEEHGHSSGFRGLFPCCCCCYCFPCCCIPRPSRYDEEAVPVANHVSSGAVTAKMDRGLLDGNV